MAERRKVHFDTESDALSDISHLRGGYTQLGDWTLPQICWHCSAGMRGTLHLPAKTEPTDEQRKAQEFIHAVAEGGWPSGQRFNTVPAMDPAAGAGDEAVEEFMGLLRQMQKYAQSHADHQHFFGPVPIKPYRKFVLNHLAHHLSFLVPTKPAKRTLNFANEMEALAEIVHLRAGHVQAGNWSLAQVAYHLNVPLARSLTPPATLDLTPEQQERNRLLDQWLRNRYSTFITAPPDMVPPDDVTDAAIDTYIDTLRKLLLYPHSHASSAFFGPVPIAKWRDLQLMHAAHHLSFLVPTKPPRRKDLAFADDGAVIAEINKLRHGYGQAGDWSLEQICWHLDATTAARMNPGEPKPNTPEQDAMKPVFERLLKTGKLPPGIKAPDLFIPPADLHDDVIDQCIATLTKWNSYTGPVAQHRIFGNLTLDQAKILNRAHCANHLSCLLPLGK